MPEDKNRPSQSRSITFLTENNRPLKLPEGIAISLTPGLMKLQEGDNFRAIATFQNLTETDFQDSIEVVINHVTSLESKKLTLKISPLKGKETLSLPIHFPTIGEPGKHEILVDFNSSKLPEAIYLNNLIRYSYEVMPDIIPPILNVYLDGRQIYDKEFVSSQPVINIQIVDENKFLIDGTILLVLKFF